MKVMKFGGSCLKNADDFELVADIIQSEKEDKVIVLSGVYGVTDRILNFLEENYREEDVPKFIEEIRELHIEIGRKIIPCGDIFKETERRLGEKLKILERLLYGVHYVGELTEKTRDLILSYGERFSVLLMEGLLRCKGLNARALESEQVGLITDGNFGNATADLPETERNLRLSILPLIRRGIVPIVTGFFGCDSRGRVTLFGRNGSDYSASVIAYGVNAEIVEIWKDVEGFMSADPKFVEDAHFIDSLSYDEVAELAYFGARILHPRAVEPLKLKNIPMRIKNIYKRENPGTLIHATKKIWEGRVIKSVTYKEEIGSIKIYGAGVGSKPGVLGDITKYLSENRINIKSVITSQTCITLLLEKEDVERSYRILSQKDIKTVERIEKVRGISLVAIVGEGILEYPGIAAKVFRAVASKDINVEMFAAGASEVAFYFIIKKKYLKDAVEAIHRVFFGGSGDDKT